MAPKKGWKRPPFSEETRRKMSESAKRRFADPVMNAAFRKRMKSRKPATPETRRKLSEAAKRRYLDPAQRELTRQRALEQWSNPEIIAKLKATKKKQREERLKNV